MSICLRLSPRCPCFCFARCDSMVSSLKGQELFLEVCAEGREMARWLQVLCKSEVWSLDSQSVSAHICHPSTSQLETGRSMGLPGQSFQPISEFWVQEGGGFIVVVHTFNPVTQEAEGSLGV